MQVNDGSGAAGVRPGERIFGLDERALALALRPLGEFDAARFVPSGDTVGAPGICGEYALGTVAARAGTEEREFPTFARRQLDASESKQAHH
jgi:hypothetical protein